MPTSKRSNVEHSHRNVETHSQDVERAAVALGRATDRIKRQQARYNLTAAIVNEVADLSEYMTDYALTKSKSKK